VPFGPGGASDIVARLVAGPLQSEFGQPFVVENRPGAGGTLGAAAAAAAAPDGYTLLVTANGPIAISPAMYQSIPYDPMRSFRHIALVGVVPFVAVVQASKLPVTDLRSLAELLRARPVPIAFGSYGNGSVGHIAAIGFMKDFGIQMDHAPYRTAALMQNDLLAGNLSLAFDGLPQALEHIRAGTLRPLAVTTAQRSPLLPTVPTAAEAGAPTMAVDNWLGISAPAGLPDAIVKRLEDAIIKAIAEPDVAARLDTLGFLRPGLKSEAFTAMLQQQVDTWIPMIREAGIKAE
jgi:tripartite-type tricarboxylate transporter receptor subunit TctC